MSAHEEVTFEDATERIDAALRDPKMAAKVAAVRAEMRRDDEAELFDLDDVIREFCPELLDEP